LQRRKLFSFAAFFQHFLFFLKWLVGWLVEDLKQFDHFLLHGASRDQQMMFCSTAAQNLGRRRKNFSALEQMKQKIETNFLQHFQGEKTRPEKTLLVKIFCIFKMFCLSFF
jgi:hypothetical protein